MDESRRFECHGKLRFALHGLELHADEHNRNSGGHGHRVSGQVGGCFDNLYVPHSSHGHGGSTNSNSLSATTLLANQPPVAVSVTPSSGSGLGPQTFSYLYSDGSGYQNISFAESILGTTSNLAGSCSTMYVPATSSVYLMNDAGGSWLGPLTIGHSGTLQNSQCTLNAQTSSASGSGTSLTVNLALSFQPTFIGLLNNFMLAQDTVNNFTSGVQNLGTWTASAVMAPNSGSITAQGDFDGDGKADIAIFRPASGTWYIIPSSNPGTPIVQRGD